MNYFFPVLLLCITNVFSYAQDIILNKNFGDKGIFAKSPSGLGNVLFERATAIIELPDGKIIVSIEAASTIRLTRYLPNGTLDKSFGKNGFSESLPGFQSRLVRTPDGVIVLVGNKFGTKNNLFLAHFNEDGQWDKNFGEGGTKTILTGDWYNVLADVVLQPDGKLLLCGRQTLDPKQRGFIIRLLPDGTPDASFFANTGLEKDTPSVQIISGIALSGKKIIAGTTIAQGSSSDMLVMQFLEDGSPDTGFGTYGQQKIDIRYADWLDAIAVQKDGKIIAAGGMGETSFTQNDFTVVRLLPDGKQDDTFGESGVTKVNLTFYNHKLRRVKADADNRIVLAGFVQASGQPLAFARLSEDGLPDKNFGEGGKLLLDPSPAGRNLDDLILLAGGGYLAAGHSFSFSEPNPSLDYLLVALHPNGRPDEQFGPQGILTNFLPAKQAYFEQPQLYADGKILLRYTGQSEKLAQGFLRLLPNGTTDESFGENGFLNENGFQFAILPDQRLVFLETIYDYSANTSRVRMRRYTTGGKPDLQFGEFGQKVLNLPNKNNITINSLNLSSDGKLLVLGSFYKSDGGHQSFMTLLDANGDVVENFGIKGDALIEKTADDFIQSTSVQPDGKILVQGINLVVPNYYSRFFVRRYTAKGVLDESFGNKGTIQALLGDESHALRVIAQPDGKILISSVFRFAAQDYKSVLFRYNNDGSPDSTFGEQGVAGVPNVIAALLKNNKIVLANGVLSQNETFSDAALTLLNADGTTDKSFGVNGTKAFRLGDEDDAFWNIIINDDKAYAVGSRNSGLDQEAVLASFQILYETTLDAAVSGFTLVDAATNKDVKSLTEGSVVDLAEFGKAQLNIRATTNSGKVGSVVLELQGPLSAQKTENILPYALFGDDNKGGYYGATLPTGNYTLTATPFGKAKGEGSNGKSLTVNFQVVNSTSISSLTLINTNNHQDIMPLHDGDTINLAMLPSLKLNIRANTDPGKIGSVVFNLQGPKSRIHTENILPYALFGDDTKGGYYGDTLPVGAYTFTVTPFSGTKGEGAKGVTKTITFYVLYQEVQSFTLVNAETGKDITLLRTGDVIDLSMLFAQKLNIRANTNPGSVGSVTFKLHGPEARTRTENLVPYALFAKTGKNYNGWIPATGTYLLTATPFSGKGGSGQKGRGQTIVFSVVNNGLSSRLLATGVTKNNAVVTKAGLATLLASPNPFTSRTTVIFSVEDTGYATLGVFNMSGTEVARLYQGQLNGSQMYQVNFAANALPAGVYLLRLVKEKQQLTYKVVLIH